MLIIKSLMMNKYRIFSQQDLNSLQLKNLCRFRQKLIKARTKVKIQLVSYMDLLFPELQYFFKSGIHGKAVYALLKECSNPDKIATMHLTRLSNLLNKTSKGHFKRSHAVCLKELAAQSVGTKNDTLSLQIKQSIIQIYAGLDPSVHQSGNYQAARTRMSKRGSKLLRYALINAAWQTTLVNKTFQEYFDLKVSQGRRHYNALGHVAHKLVRVIHKMMTDNLEFNLA